MTVELRMPSLGMAMDEGRLAAWLVKQGDHVKRGQVLAEIESEKVAYELESPADGIVGAILVSVDDVVPVGTTLATIDDGTGTTPTPIDSSTARDSSEPPPRPAQLARAGNEPTPTRPNRLSPRARALAESLGVDASTLTGTGAGGMVVEDDIRRAARRSPSREETPEPASIATPFVLRPLSMMRRTIAERMTASVRETPHFYLSIDVDASALVGYRKARLQDIQTKAGVRLTLTDVLVLIVGQTLRNHPSLNACYAPDGVREWSEVNIALAVAVDNGLQAPVIRGADARPLEDLARARADLVDRARAGKLRAEDVAGGTFSLSNLGGLGVDFFSSIITPGQSAILSVGALRDRPAIVGGEVVSRPMMSLGLTIDHRVTDGAVGARFLDELRTRVEQLSERA